MGLDINTKKLKKNAFRVSKERGIGASRIRVPGGYLNAEVLGMVQEIAQTYGNGYVHLTTRQGFEIEGIRLEDMDEINKKLQPIIEMVGINQDEPDKGYPASGTRNISACIGNNVCPFANYNTADLARKIEQEVYPHDLHFKIGLTGCSNDCGKARMHDFGIIGMTMPQYDPDRCVNCQACVKGCKSLSVDALRVENYKIQKNAWVVVCVSPNAQHVHLQEVRKNIISLLLWEEQERKIRAWVKISLYGQMQKIL